MGVIGKTLVMKKIGIVNGDPSHGLVYQRAHLPLRELRHKYEFVPLSYSEFQPEKAFYLDAVIMVHPWHPEHALFARRIRGHYGIPVIVDIDDLLTNLPSDHPNVQEFRSNQLEDILTIANHVTTSTEYLKMTWGHLNKNIRVIPNCIDEKRYIDFKDRRDHVVAKPYHSGFVVGWTGSQSHRSDLVFTGFIEGLTLLMDKYDDVRAFFHVLCPQTLIDRFGSRVIFQERTVDFLDWPSICFTFPFDVCAVPLLDHPFNDAKSDLRLIDMAPFRIPLIASPRKDFIRHAERDFMVYADKGEWFEALEWAYLHRSDLAEMGDKAHDYVMSERVSTKAAELWDQLFQAIFHQDQPSPALGHTESESATRCQHCGKCTTVSS